MSEASTSWSMRSVLLVMQSEGELQVTIGPGSLHVRSRELHTQTALFVPSPAQG